MTPNDINRDKKFFIDKVYELEKENFLLSKVLRDYNNSLEQFNEEIKRKLFYKDNQIRDLVREMEKINKEKKIKLLNLEKTLPKFNVIIWTIFLLFFCFMDVIVMLIIDQSSEFIIPYISWTFWIPILLATIMCNVRKWIKKPKYNRKYAEICEDFDNKISEIEKKNTQYLQEKEEMQKNYQKNFDSYEKFVKNEIGVIEKYRDKLDFVLYEIYKLNDFPSELRNFPSIAEIKHYLDVVGDCTGENWNIALIYGERVSKLHRIDSRLNEFEQTMNNFKETVKAEIRQIMKENYSEISNIKSKYFNLQENFNKEIGKLEFSYQKNAERAYFEALNYLKKH